MSIEKIKVLREINHLVQDAQIQVCWRVTVKEGDEILSQKDHYEVYTAADVERFCQELPTHATAHLAAAGWLA